MLVLTLVLILIFTLLLNFVLVFTPLLIFVLILNSRIPPHSSSHFIIICLFVCLDYLLFIFFLLSSHSDPSSHFPTHLLSHFNFGSWFSFWLWFCFHFFSLFVLIFVILVVLLVLLFHILVVIRIVILIFATFSSSYLPYSQSCFRSSSRHSFNSSSFSFLVAS